MMNNRIIFLAGGNSKRFGENKLLYEYKGKKLYIHCFEKLLNIVKRHENYSITVVTQYDEIFNFVTKLNLKNVSAVFSKECEKGISYSIKAGINSLKKEDAYDTFIVADQPFIEERLLEDFFEKAIKSGKATAAIKYKDDILNPNMFRSFLEKDLLELSEDRGGKSIILKNIKNCFLYEITDKSCMKDIDYKKDLENFKNK